MSIRKACVALLVALFSQQLGQAQTTPERAPGPQRTELHKPTVSVSMDDWGGRPVVEARINGQGPFKLLIDTGTTFPAVLNNALVKNLKLAESGTRKLQTEDETLETVEIGTLAIGEAEFSSFPAICSDVGGCVPSDSHRIVGIIGLPLFQDCLLTLDFPKRRVRLESGTLPPPDGETIEYSGEERHDYGVTVTLSAAGRARQGSPRHRLARSRHRVEQASARAAPEGQATGGRQGSNASGRGCGPLRCARRNPQTRQARMGQASHRLRGSRSDVDL